MSTLILKIANEDGFFKRGKRLAKLADAAKTIPQELVISFEEPGDLPPFDDVFREVLRVVRAADLPSVEH